MQHGEIAVEPGVDRTQLLDRRGHRPDELRIAPGLRNPLEPHVTLLAQPVERPARERDPVLGRRPRESQRNVVGRHRTIVAPAIALTGFLPAN